MMSSECLGNKSITEEVPYKLGAQRLRDIAVLIGREGPRHQSIMGNVEHRICEAEGKSEYLTLYCLDLTQAATPSTEK